MILIKIAKESIKKNPKAFQTRTIVRESKEIIVSGHGKNVPVILNYNNFHMTNMEQSSFGLNKWKGYLSDEKIIDKLQKVEGVNIEINRNYQTFEHAPLPEYLFEYENTNVECPSCNTHFMSNDFESDIDEDDENYCDTICPNCKHWIKGVIYQKIKDLKIEI